MPLWQIRSYRIPEIRDPRTTPYPELYQAYFRPRAFQSEFSQGRAGVQMDRPLFIESFVSSGRDCRSSCPFLIFGFLLLYSNMSSMKFPVSQSLELKLFLRGSRKVNIGEVWANSATVETTFSGGNGASVISMKITKYWKMPRFVWWKKTCFRYCFW